MKIKELEQKYGKELIKKLIKDNYLEGCTIVVNKDGTEDIPEIDIINAIKHLKGIPFELD